MHVFARQGIVKTKMIDIAKEAGVGKGTIYEYFRSKDGIFNSAFHLLFKTTEQAIGNALSTTDDPVLKLKLLMQTSYDTFLHDGGEFAAIMMDFWAEGVRNKDSQALEIIDLKSIYAEYRQIIISVLQEGIASGIFKKMDVDSMAAGLIGMFDGILLQWIMDRDTINIKKISTTVMDGILNGIQS